MKVNKQEMFEAQALVALSSSLNGFAKSNTRLEL